MDEDVRINLLEHERRINALEYDMNHSKSEDIKRDQQYNDLMALLLDIRSRLDKQDGTREGASGMAKLLWTLFGSIIVAAILGVSSLLWDLHAKIAVLENVNRVN